ncbi:AfsR/SARP family transcriptional regulator [Paractinoplanes atraurantiacus]|uniref:DNA-binding transcriptional activator of the SARP family n=1 Tax=Paractinoplanes atraurantiacus TaxID=1036182 RepID=A0A285K8B8_9ACTN|nr:bacterial transcriptional activator domain-containing protein [Actinoplanes atraurantiacus]SNY68840.1 DNA-binding transcriptional activator of the SARP family [Actinoplanes atraurantiacus]
MIRFAILGPVSLRDGDRELHAGAGRQRTVLALLLARAGAVLGQNDLVELVWGDDPPASAANVLHRSIGQLRRLMEPHLPIRSSGSLLSRVGDGYLLRADESTLDLLEFRGLVASAPVADDPVGRYLRALALWRGPCAEGLDPSPVFDSVDGERSQAARDAADAALRAGQAARVLPALREVARDQPLDEPLQSRLMLALAADGQRDRALGIFHAVSERLGDELGIDPGAELRAARDTLRRRPAVRPAQLPSDHPFLLPRLADRATAEISHQRATGPAVLSIDGVAGVGKSILAIHLAHRIAPSCPDGQLYADVRDLDPVAVLRGFLTSLGEPTRKLPDDLPSLAGRWRALLTGRRILVVLDNCATLDPHLLPGTPGSVVITTSRTEGTFSLTLPSHAEATTMLRRRLGPDRVAAEPRAVAEIVERCGRLPAALARAAAAGVVESDLPLAYIAAELGAELGSGPGAEALADLVAG